MISGKRYRYISKRSEKLIEKRRVNFEIRINVMIVTRKNSIKNRDKND
jgi:hypothetical protein